MSRRIGAFVQFDESALRKLVDIPQEMIDRVEDLSPVMAVIATDDLKPEILENLATQGGGTWAPKDADTIRRWGNRPLGIGEHGGFAPTIQRGWSKSNAVAFTRAPHAHLFEFGTDYYSVNGARAFRWSQGQGTITRGKNKGKIRIRHKSKAASRAFGLAKPTMAQHQPARPFAYIDKDVQERSTRRLGAFIVEEAYRGTV